MKVLFLDIDGVLNSSDWFDKTRGNKIGRIYLPTEPYPQCHLDPAAIERLNRIIDDTGCKVVISSTWRINNEPETIAKNLALKGFRHLDAVIGKTPVFRHEGRIRGDEIAAWLSQRNVERFAIVDDDSDMGGLMPYLVKTDWEHGLTDLEANALIRLLRTGLTT